MTLTLDPLMSILHLMTWTLNPTNVYILHLMTLTPLMSILHLMTLTQDLLMSILHVGPMTLTLLMSILHLMTLTQDSL